MLEMARTKGLALEYLLGYPKDDGHPDVMGEGIVNTRYGFGAYQAALYAVVDAFADLDQHFGYKLLPGRHDGLVRALYFEEVDEVELVLGKKVVIKIKLAIKIGKAGAFEVKRKNIGEFFKKILVYAGYNSVLIAIVVSQVPYADASLIGYLL
jgi:hypothetical protein